MDITYLNVKDFSTGYHEQFNATTDSFVTSNNKNEQNPVTLNWDCDMTQLFPTPFSVTLTGI